MEHPRVQLQNCEICGTPIRFRTVTALDGRPDFLQPLFPDTIWLGWEWGAQAPEKLELIALCTQACMTRWFEIEEGPGV